MKSNNPILLLAAICALTAWAGSAAAQDNSIRIGGYFVRYNVSADDLTGPFVPSGVNLDVKNVNTIYFAYVRRLNEHVDFELTAGVPPKTETIGKGPAVLGSVPYDGQVIATAKWFSPTLLLKYTFLPESARLRPFIGGGVNYTHFFDRKVTPEGAAVDGGPTSIALTDSFGPAVTVGVSYHVQGAWYTYASYSVAKVESKLTANTAGIERSTSINFNPSSLVVSVGYSF